LANLGLKEKIGVGETEFEGSSWGRATNIRVGSARYQGLLIPPGEEFSFNEHVGNVTPDEGYVKEYVIWKNKVELQYGGGLCQVSTTLFRAAVFAGLPILERSGHAFAVAWYDWPYGPGMDATIYAPYTDLKIKNDTPAYIFMNVYVTENNHLIWELWGTRDRKVEVVGPYKVWMAADGSMKTNFTRTIRYNDGRELSEDFSTVYESPSKYSH
jgi:vancomycin resistance protein YoaR